MLDLDARVHLHEIKTAVLVEQEFKCPGARVADLLARLDGDRAHFLALLLCDRGRRSFFEQFLMTALDRAFALAEMDTVAVLVRQHLDLDVTRSFDVSLDINRTVLKRGQAPRSVPVSRLVASSSSSRTIRIPRPPPPAAALMITGKPISLSELHRLFRRFDRFGAAGQDRNAGGGHRSPGFDLVAHHRDNVGTRTDELDVAVLADLRECRRLGEEIRIRDGSRRRL